MESIVNETDADEIGVVELEDEKEQQDQNVDLTLETGQHGKWWVMSYDDRKLLDVCRMDF
jgi:hypothetical protein